MEPCIVRCVVILCDTKRKEHYQLTLPYHYMIAYSTSEMLKCEKMWVLNRQLLHRSTFSVLMGCTIAQERQPKQSLCNKVSIRYHQGGAHRLLWWWEKRDLHFCLRVWEPITEVTPSCALAFLQIQKGRMKWEVWGILRAMVDNANANNIAIANNS